MPFQFDEGTTAGGLRYMIVDTAGHVSLDDGRELEARLLAGRQRHGGYILARVAKGTDYSPEVRRFFPSLRGKYSAAGVVVTSPVARAWINTILRFSGAPTVRMFASEDEALAWLVAAHAELRG